MSASSIFERIRSDFDDFLEEEGLLADVEAAAFKRVIAYQLEELPMILFKPSA